MHSDRRTRAVNTVPDGMQWLRNEHERVLVNRPDLKQEVTPAVQQSDGRDL